MSATRCREEVFVHAIIEAAVAGSYGSQPLFVGPRL